MEDKIIGGESPVKGTIGGDENKTPLAEPAIEVPDLDAELNNVTKRGGLDAVPASFELKTGYWKTILSENPFEVLYLDYRQYHLVTPEMVQKNFGVLSAFWKEKILLLNGSNREKIKSRYTEDTVNHSMKKLEAAFQKIKTREGIELYYKDLETKRYNKGIKAIEDLIDTVLAGEQLFKEQADKIIAKGVQNGLNVEEVRKHLQQTLVKNQFKVRSTTKFEDEFEGKWMTDRQWKITQARATNWLGATVSTLEETGEVTFHNKDKAYNFIANSNYLPVVVTQLTSAEKGYEFEEIIKNETDLERRYLKVIYHLNPYLPFRIDNYQFTGITQVFDMSFNDYNLFSKAASSYAKGYFHIWLNESDPVNAAKLTKGYDYNSFLEFLYEINETHPFYLKSERFHTPVQLIKTAAADASIWPTIAGAISNGQLPVWFEGIGKIEWNRQHNAEMKAFFESTFHNEQDKNMAAVQTLIRIVDPSLSFPGIVPDVGKIELLHVEGSHPFKQSFKLKLRDEGFVKAIIIFEKLTDGIQLSERDLTFHSQAGTTEKEMWITIDALRLTKNKTYSTRILVSSVYETIFIPVDVRVVFPTKAYFLQLIKYMIILAVFFGGTRFLLGEITGFKTWLGSMLGLAGYTPLETSEYYLPENYFMFFMVLILLLAGLIWSFFLIRKFEKI